MIDEHATALPDRRARSTPKEKALRQLILAGNVMALMVTEVGSEDFRMAAEAANTWARCLANYRNAQS